MPDLRSAAIAEWLTANGSIDTARTVHTQSADDTSLDDAITAFGSALDTSVENGSASLEDGLGNGLTTPFADAMTSFDPGRRLRLLHWLTEAEFDDPHRVINQITDPGSVGSAALLRWMGALLRREQLDRLFSPERIEVLRNACRKAGQTEKTT